MNIIDINSIKKVISTYYNIDIYQICQTSINNVINIFILLCHTILIYNIIGYILLMTYSYYYHLNYIYISNKYYYLRS